MNEDYAVYWYHTSKYGASNNKAKVRFFEKKEKANKFYLEMLDKQIDKITYQQGSISCISKNWDF